MLKYTFIFLSIIFLFININAFSEETKSANITETLNTLNFSCDINLKCFDKNNQIELVILTNNTSTVKIPETLCGDRDLQTNGLLLIPGVNSSLSVDRLESSGMIVDRSCNFRGSDIISGIYSARVPIPIEQFFGEMNYSLPEGIILTNNGMP